MSPYDAIGNEVFVIQNSLKKMGYSSEIYAENIHPEMKNKVKNYYDCKDAKNDDIFIFHLSIGFSSGMFNFLSSLRSKIIMIYHNITPPEFFEGKNNALADLLRLGRKQLEGLKDKVSVAVGDSEHNRLELESFGYKVTGVFPILLDLSKYKQASDLKLISQYKDQMNVLYVGRITPNKKVDEVIKAFAYYHCNINPSSNLFLVGTYESPQDKYFTSLQKMINTANLKNIFFITNADDVELITYYSLARVFITMSMHEGFCVPLVESMFYKIPIIANNSTAIPYTLGESGILVKNETYEEVGELIDVIESDSQLRNSVIERETRRFNAIYNKDNESMLSDLLSLVK
jgi:glycosyltransferase involved in cell wall biosynthesis